MMDAFDARILRELGIEPFMAWPRRNVGFRLTDVARRLDRNLQFVKDRVARMEEEGVITGYRYFPNLHHVDMQFSTYRWPAGFVPDREKLAGLGNMDGFFGVVWCLDSSLCLDLTYTSRGERERRLKMIQSFLGTENSPLVFYEKTFPAVGRRLTPVDWRIVRALEQDARRPLSDVADDIGITAKTVRNRFNTMLAEGSIDGYVTLGFERMSGIIPFQMSVWYEPDAGNPEKRILEHFDDRYLGHFNPPSDGYSSFLLRIFAFTPSEVQSLVKEAIDLDGVRDAEAALATGAYYNQSWMPELLERQLERAPMRLP